LNGFVWRGVFYRGRVEFEFKIKGGKLCNMKGNL
jgi:hypothetical protein